MIHFMGACKYLLTGNVEVNGQPQFQVLVRNEYRWGNTAVSYTRYVECVYDDFTVRLGEGQIITVSVF